MSVSCRFDTPDAVRLRHAIMLFADARYGAYAIFCR